jgi:hypothetical protein
VSYLLGAGIEFGDALNPVPRALFGVVKNGIVLGIYAVAMGAICILAGRGLYSLRESARKLAVNLNILWIVDYSCWAVIDPPKPGKLAVRLVTHALTVTICGLTIWYLHSRRQVFF